MGNKVTQWVLELIDNLTAPLRTAQGAAEGAQDAVNDVADAVNGVNKAGNKLPDMAAKVGATAFAFNQFSDAIGKFNAEFQKGIAPGVEFQTQMAELSAITQKSGKDLDDIGGRARNLAKEFGGDASAYAGSFINIIGSFGDKIADSSEALGAMGRNVAILSKSMQGDATSAARALTTSMLQYGVDLNDPMRATEEMARMMNVMVAGGNVGSSEVLDTSEALRVSGLVAKQAGLGFEEYNSTLQALAEGGYKGSEAGTHLRGVLLAMLAPQENVRKTMEAAGIDMNVVSDTSLRLSDRLRALSSIQGNSTLQKKIFGESDYAAGAKLLEMTDQIDEWTGAITGTSAATAAASINMDTYSQKMSRTNAFIGDLKISFFETIESIAPFITIAGDGVGAAANMGFAISGLSIILKKDLWIALASTVRGIAGFIASAAVGAASAIKFAITGGLSFTTFASAARVACRAVSTAIHSIPIIGWVIGVIAVLTTVVAYFYNTSAEFRGILWGVWEVIKVSFTGYYKFIWEVMQAIWHVIKGVFDPRNWFNDDYKFSNALDKVKNAALEYGENVGKAFAEGKTKGMADYEEGDIEISNRMVAAPGLVVSAVMGDAERALNIKKRKESKALNLSGSGGTGGGKSITMNLTMHNHFNGIKNVDEMVNVVVRRINDKLNDSLAAI